MKDDIYHISEEDFEKVCRKVVAKHKGTRSLRYIPADWDWHHYPDIGFSEIIDDATGISLTRGFHEYTKMADGSLRAEDIIRRCSPTNGMGDPFKVDTKEQLLQLIKETFKL